MWNNRPGMNPQLATSLPCAMSRRHAMNNRRAASRAAGVGRRRLGRLAGLVEMARAADKMGMAGESTEADT